MTEEQNQNIKIKAAMLAGLGSNLFAYKWITKNIGYFLFVAALTVLYIANGHKADQMIRNINITSKEVKEMQYEYKTLKSEVIFKSRETQVIKAAQPLGLQMPNQPPMRIMLQNTKTNEKPYKSVE